MSHLRTLKINNVNDGGEHILNLKRIALYNNTKKITNSVISANSANSANGKCILSVKKNGEIYRPNVNVNSGGCLVSSSNYELLLDVTKGKYLDYFKCNTDFSYSPTGNINDGNLFSVVDRDIDEKVYADRKNTNLQNQIDITPNYKTVFSTPGVTLLHNPNNCNKDFDIETLHENMDMNMTNDSNIAYNNMLGKQDVYDNFKYPMRFQI